MTDFFNEQKNENAQLKELKKESDKMMVKGGIGCLIPIVIFIILMFVDSALNLLWILLGIACISGVYSIIYMFKSSSVDDKIKVIEMNKKMRVIGDQKRELVEKYGKISKEVYLDKLDMLKYIFIFEDSMCVWIFGDVLLMRDILQVTCDDHQTIKHGEAMANTKTKTGSMVARTIVGSAVMGVPGAIIGGATAKQKTKINQEDDTIIHDYTVVLNVNSISNPIIHIHVGDDEYLTNEIIGLFQVIIRRYQNLNKSDESSMR